MKGDLTRLKKQFNQLACQSSFNIIDLKDYILWRGILQRKESGSLVALVEKVLGLYLPKDDAIRKNEQWEVIPLAPELLHYAALDVYASRLIFERATNIAPFDQVAVQTPPGTMVALLIQSGGNVAAYGRISKTQPASLGGVRVRVPTKSRLVVDVDKVVIPSAAAILHLLPQSPLPSSQKTKAGAFTLAQLQAASSTDTFAVVAPVKLLTFDHQNPVCCFLSSAIIFSNCILFSEL